MKKVVLKDSRHRNISSRIKMSSVSLNPDVFRLLKRVNEIPDMPVIELLANDGKLTANRTGLRLASSAVH